MCISRGTTVALASALWMIALTPAGRADTAPAWCNQNLLRESSNSSLATGYRVRGGGQYCEGVVSRPSAGALEIVGFHSGTLGSGDSPITLALTPEIRTYANGKGSLQLLAADWSGTSNYRLDASLQSADLKVDTKQVLAPAKIDRSNLGFLAWINSNSEPEYLPVVLTSNATSLEVIAVSPIPLRMVRATLLDRLTLKPLQKDFMQANVRERTPVVIPIEAGVAAGAATLKIVAWDNYRDDPTSGPIMNLVIPSRR